MVQDEPLLLDPGRGLPPGDGVANPVGTGGTPDGVPDESMPGAPTPEQPEVGGSGGSDATPDGMPDESMPEAPTPEQPGDAPMGDPGGEGDEAPPDMPPDAPMPDGPGSAIGPAVVEGNSAGAHRPPGGGGQKRKGPRDRGPRERAPHGWVTSIQQAIRTKATCRDCGHPFIGEELRVSTAVNARGNRSTYSHVECTQGGSTRSTRSSTTTPSLLSTWPGSRPSASPRTR